MVSVEWFLNPETRLIGRTHFTRIKIQNILASYNPLYNFRYETNISNDPIIDWIDLDLAVLFKYRNQIGALL